MNKINEIEYEECTTSAASSTANLGPGYDVFGLGLDALEDIIRLKVIKKSKNNLGNIKIEIKGEGSKSIPIDPERNSSGKVAKKIITDYDLYKYDCIIDIEKNV